MITYCTNIHPGERWDDVRGALFRHLPAIKSAVSPDEPFPIGLRLSHRAAQEISEGMSRELLDWCEEQGCFIPTINGFPYGDFHAKAVKERVYLPDWRSPERVSYTKRLADLLDSWLPPGVTGSISTVPVGFKRFIQGTDYPAITRNLISVLEHLSGLSQRSGKHIILALEAEPGCVLETTDDIVDFFDTIPVPLGLREHLGICYDCCHQAVLFEDPASSLASLSAAGIRIGKVQVSSALRLTDFDKGGMGIFQEPVYLHQVAIRRHGDIIRYDDLPEALANHRSSPGEEWRVHFHMPIFMEGTSSYGTTRSFIEELLPLLSNDMLLEVETYTWSILPPDMRSGSITESVCRELSWLRSKVDETNCSP